MSRQKDSSAPSALMGPYNVRKYYAKRIYLRTEIIIIGIISGSQKVREYYRLFFWGGGGGIESDYILENSCDSCASQVFKLTS